MLLTLSTFLSIISFFFPLYTNFYFLIFKWMMTTVPQAVGLLCV